MDEKFDISFPYNLLNRRCRAFLRARDSFPSRFFFFFIYLSSLFTWIRAKLCAMNRRFFNVSMARISQFECKSPELGSLFQSTAGQEGSGISCVIISLSRRPEKLERKKAQSFSIKSTLLSNRIAGSRVGFPQARREDTSGGTAVNRIFVPSAFPFTVHDLVRLVRTTLREVLSS